MIGSSARTERRTQRGQGLLLLMLVMLVAGASVLLEGIGSRASNRAGDDQRTARVLAQAKEALIAYAVTHPELPGRLPYPDRALGDDNFDGISDCVTSSLQLEHRFGRFPWRGTISTLSGCGPTWPLTEHLRDAAGSSLWYAVSDKLLRRHPDEAISLNVGLLDPGGSGDWLTVVDGNGQVLSDRVAAVIIAPGEAIGPQDRNVAISNPNYPAQFLDSVVVNSVSYSNANTDGVYIIHDAVVPDDGSDVTFNDRLVYITADELLRAVEQRVLGELAISLRAYSASWPEPGPSPIFPWLKAFEDPRTATSFHGTHGQEVGLLPMHNPAGESFTSPWSVTWSGLSAEPEDFPYPPWGTVDAADLLSSPPDGLVIPDTTGVCEWFAAQPGRARCSHSGQVTDTFTLPAPAGLTITGIPVISVTRTYRATDLDVEVMSGDSSVPTKVHAPTGGEVRTRDVVGAGTFASGVRIEIVDYPVVHVLGVPVLLTIPVGQGELNTDGSTVAAATSLLSVRYSLDPASELPDWFAANEWHRFIFAAGSSSNLGGGSADCPADNNCLSLRASNGSPASNGVGFALISAGGVRAGHDRLAPQPPLDPTAYLEGANSVAVGGVPMPPPITLARGAYSAEFNDQLRVVEPLPDALPSSPPPTPVLP